MPHISMCSSVLHPNNLRFLSSIQCSILLAMLSSSNCCNQFQVVRLKLSHFFTHRVKNAFLQKKTSSNFQLYISVSYCFCCFFCFATTKTSLELALIFFISRQLTLLCLTDYISGRVYSSATL